jgi:prepilin-type N-terminal cleavage/methylation domain-containing protein
MKRKGFTLVELLVVIAIIALLMGILMPALAKVRQIAFRMVCGTNQAAIGKAMLVYSNEHNDKYPVAGWGISSSPEWESSPKISDFTSDDRKTAFPDATISASFYALIKFTDCTPKMFVCKGDVGAEVFSMDKADIPTALNVVLQDLWDFGGGQGAQWKIPATFCSYSYHMPYKFRGAGQSYINTAITATSDPATPVCSDRNPYLDGNATDRIDRPEEYGFEAGPGITPKKYNSECHEIEGQNVLYNDGHVDFEGLSNVGIGKDNIWSSWGPVGTARPKMEVRKWPESPNETTRVNGQGFGVTRQDAYLVSNSTN